MPSGSKRRKAAAKKKQQQSPTPSGSEATTFNGGDYLKGLESNGSEVNSPASQDLIQTGAQSFKEEGVDRESSPVRQTDSEKVNVVEEVGIVKVDEDDGRVEITRELKLVEGSGGRGEDLSVEVGKNSDSSSSSSSSDDEEIRIEKPEVVLDSARVEEVYEVVENAEDPVVPAIVLEEAVENAEDPVVPAVVLEEVVETADDPRVPSVVLAEVVSVSEAAPVEDLYEDLDKPVLSELNSELKATKEDAHPAILSAVVTHGESSNVDSFNLKDAEDNVLPPSDSPVAVIHNAVEYHLKDPEIQDAPEQQTPVLQAPLSVQRTSWKGCCGLFEVFTGSR